jgi:hypothetical protein
MLVNATRAPPLFGRCGVNFFHHTSVHKFPVHRTVAIFPGVSSALNFAGRSTARCGMCKSPMHNTKTILNVT